MLCSGSGIDRPDHEHPGEMGVSTPRPTVGPTAKPDRYCDTTAPTITVICYGRYFPLAGEGFDDCSRFHERGLIGSGLGVRAGIAAASAAVAAGVFTVVADQVGEHDTTVLDNAVLSETVEHRAGPYVMTRKHAAITRRSSVTSSIASTGSVRQRRPSIVLK
jgi:hypothetical protein